MTTEIKCPNCGTEFELNESLKNEVEKELRGKMMDWQKKKEDEFEKQKTALINDTLRKATDDTLVKIKALEEDILNINKLAFLFPKNDTLNLKASDTFTGALTDVANRIKDYKKPSLKEAEVVTIDNNIIDIKSD